MPKQSFWKEFGDFLREFNVITLAVGFVMGGASQALVRSLVENIIMPFVAILMPKQGWQEATWQWGPLVLRWGAFLSEVINFIILAFVVFLIVKKLLKDEKKDEKVGTK